MISLLSLMDIWLEKTSPSRWENGHVEETPNGWEQRFERVDGDVKQGKVEINWIFSY